MPTSDILSILPIATFNLMVVSLLGGCSYLFWHAVSEKVPAVAYVFGILASIPAIGLMIWGGRGDLWQFLYFSTPLIIPIFLGSWLHRLSVKGTTQQNLAGYAPSILLMLTATGSSFFFGLRLLDYLAASSVELVGKLCLLSLILTPSLTPLLIWGWRNMKPRAGYDTQFEE